MREGEVVCPTIPSLARVSRVSELVSGLSVSLAGETRNKAGKAVPTPVSGLQAPGRRGRGLWRCWFFKKRQDERDCESFSDVQSFTQTYLKNTPNLRTLREYISREGMNRLFLSPDTLVVLVTPSKVMVFAPFFCALALSKTVSSLYSRILSQLGRSNP